MNNEEKLEKLLKAPHVQQVELEHFRKDGEFVYYLALSLEDRLGCGTYQSTLGAALDVGLAHAGIK